MSDHPGAEPVNNPETESGIPLEPFYVAAPDGPPPPGDYPYTRGIRAEGYRTRLWTMRQYAGFGSAEQTNERFHYLLRAGQSGLSVAFDLPTQMGYDSDDPVAHGEVGKVGVAIDSLEDMELLMRGIPQDRVTTSMTINAPAAVLLLLYELAAERKGIAATTLGGTIQNDILKEYAARGTYIYPPRPSMRLVTDTFAYCAERLPRWNTISISGYHIREAGATAPQEIAFTLSNGIAYVQAAIEAGLDVEHFAPRLSFFFNVSNDFFEEVAKFRAARAIWAAVMRERFGARGERSLQLRFHAQTSGATLTAQQPLNNVVRVSLQALAAVCGGAQSLHTNSYDEALALPSEQAVEIAVRTQQMIGHETGAAHVTDPMGGSHLVEALTSDLIDESRELMRRVEDHGGAVAAIEAGFYQEQIQELGIPLPAPRRIRRARHRRRQPVHRDVATRGADPSHRRRARDGADRAARGGAQGSLRCRSPAGAGRAEGWCAGDCQPAAAHADGARGARDRRRSVRCAPRRLRRLPSRGHGVRIEGHVVPW